MKMKQYKKVRSLKDYSRISIFILPMLFGIVLILADVIYELSFGYQMQQTKISEYESSIKEHMEENVSTALFIMNGYYTINSNRLTESELQADILDLLSQIELEDSEYLFLIDQKGNILVGPNTGENQFEAEDANGVKIIQELIRIGESGGGYLSYIIPPIDENDTVPKLTYVNSFDHYNWFIGIGVDLTEIAIIKETIRTNIIERTSQMAILTGIVVAFLTFLFWLLNRKIYFDLEGEIHLLYDYLKDAVQSDVSLDTDQFGFLEMKQMGRNIQDLLLSKNRNQAALEESNCILEEEIAEHSNTIEKLDQSKKRFSSIVEMIPDYIFIVKKSGEVVECEFGGKKWLDRDKEYYLNKRVEDFLPKEISRTALDKIKIAILSKKIQIHDFSLNLNDNEFYFEARTTAYQADEAFVILRDVTETRKTEIWNEYLSYHDQLTDTYNRRYYEEQIRKLDQMGQYPVALAIVDVNGLKMTNDAFGHQRGDQLLCMVAATIKKCCVVEGGFTARIGGDEFIIVCPKTSGEKMELISNHIYTEINKIKEYPFLISVSIGYDVKVLADQNMSEVFGKAEEVMYRKKLTESQSIRHQTIQVIVKTLNEKNEREKIHSERVSWISREIGIALGLDYNKVKEIETAGLLHDIGKIVVEQNILNKEGCLTEEEYENIKRHPESSYQILKSINAYAGLAEDVLSHHEKWDGTGYPRNLKGTEISLTARIITVADAFEAMTADRSYRKAMSKEEAMSELKRFAEVQFDPYIVKIFEDRVYPNL